MYNFYCSEQSTLEQLISQNYRNNETECVNNLLANINITNEQEYSIIELATNLITKVRSKRIKGHGIDAIMNEFKLSTNEGIALMCLAESLLRIPDKETQDQLIKEKIASGNWENYTKTENLFMKAASWGLLITGKVTKPTSHNNFIQWLLSAIAKGGAPLIRKAVITAVHFMGNQFVIGETIEKAFKNAQKKEQLGYNLSYDMLGEAALNNEDAMHYMQNYIDAIHKVGQSNNNHGTKHGNSVSVKLSAIHPRYQRSKLKRVIHELFPRIKELFKLAKQYEIALFIDAEEADRLDLSLKLLKMLLNDNDIKSFDGIGFVVQAYQKRAPYVIDYLAHLARVYNTRIQVRLVKGAYWDSEIKRAQLDGLIDYPVYTRKFYTDLSYNVCAQKLFNLQKEIYPLFATHNAYTIALIYILGKGKEFEFQCLYGMGEALYDNLIVNDNLKINCSIYAPVGNYETLLPYLIRRLLENGSNSSFVHQLVNKNIPTEKLVENPLELAKMADKKPTPYFNTPPYIYRSGRLNSRGFDLSDERTLAELEEKLNLYKNNSYTAYPLVPGYLKSDYAINLVYNPSNLNEIVGTVIKAQLNDVEKAINNALDGFKKWSIISPDIRANIIIKMSELIELNSIELIGLLVREAGKTVNNAINEVREAVDFCRYYAEQIKVEFCNNNHTPIGVFACISPWNFPLAIFIGEISSCLAVGNAVIAKPSDQTNLIAFYAVTLFHKAGIPTNVLQLLPGSGSVIGDALTKSNNIKGVIFTGSTDTARLINRNLATKDFNSVLIAETGGQNAMIVDSTALIEQVVQDVIISGFDSAGQRCSALRVLYLQTDVADKIIEAIKGAMDEFKIGNPMDFSTDVGPVIDNKAQQFLVEHIENMRTEGRQIYQSSISSECKQGTFVPPTIIEIENINELKQEFFGPIVHIIRFTNRELDQVMHEINSSGYGLTQGIHSRLEDTIIKVYQGVKAGNIYVNRNMVGAVVGVQPFGGEGLSGTGPKAGGPLYLYRLVNSNIDPQFGTQINPEKLNHINDFLSKLTIVSDSDKEQLINYAKLITSQSLFMKKLELNGPTGENNFMYFDKRGFVGCFANSLVDYARQIICALATNNKVILPYNHITIKLNNIIIDNYISFCDNIDVIDELNAVLVSKDFTNINELKKQLANRNGPLVVTIVEREGEMSGNYPLYLLITEKSISINTTATGGNIELMSVNDNLEEVI